MPWVAPVTRAVRRGGHGTKIITFRHDSAAATPRRPAQCRTAAAGRASGFLAAAAAGAAPSSPTAAHGLGDRAPLRGRDPGAARPASADPARGAVDRQAHRGRGGPRDLPDGRWRNGALAPPGRAARPGAGHRPGGRRSGPALGAAGEPARRSLRQPHQRRAHAALRHARPGAVRERRDLRQAGAGAPPDGEPHRALHPPARDHPGPDHAGHPVGGARGLRSLAAGPADRRGAAVAAGRDPLRLARVLAALLLDARAAPARLPALHRGQRRLRQGAQALRPVGFPGGALRPAVAGVLRGQQGARGAAEPGLEPALHASAPWGITRPTPSSSISR